MINTFNEIYSGLADLLVSLDSTIKTSSVYTNTPSSYPFVSVEEIEDSINAGGREFDRIENFVNKTYELNIYTNNPSKKTKGDNLLGYIDDYFANLGFERTSNIPMPTNDETLYRIVVRYSGIVSKEKTVL